MAKVYCSEAAVSAIYDCMRVVGAASYTKDLAPLERIMRDAMAFPLYDWSNQGIRRRQLHEMFRQPGYGSMLAARPSTAGGGAGASECPARHALNWPHSDHHALSR